MINYLKTPVKNEKYKGFNLGGFYKHIKYGRYKEVYNEILSKNSILKADYEKYQKFLQEKPKEIVKPERKAELL